MRKVVAVELVSLDGVMEAPEEWAFSYSNDEMEAANAKGMAASDALLLGGGKRLFEDGGGRETLELVSSETFETCVVSLAYRPSGEEGS